jgi:hypothetical protein
MPSLPESCNFRSWAPYCPSPSSLTPGPPLSPQAPFVVSHMGRQAIGTFASGHGLSVCGEETSLHSSLSTAFTAMPTRDIAVPSLRTATGVAQQLRTTTGAYSLCLDVQHVLVVISTRLGLTVSDAFRYLLGAVMIQDRSLKGMASVLPSS